MKKYENKQDNIGKKEGKSHKRCKMWTCRLEGSLRTQQTE